MQEIIGIAFAMAFGGFLGKNIKLKQDNQDNNEMDLLHIDNSIDNNAVPQCKNQKNKIGFKSDNITSNQDYNYSKDDIIDYLKCMYEKSKNNISIGQEKIRTNTGLSNKQVRGIRYYLNKKKIINVDGKNTQILVSNFENAVKKIN